MIKAQYHMQIIAQEHGSIGETGKQECLGLLDLP